MDGLTRVEAWLTAIISDPPSEKVELQGDGDIGSVRTMLTDRRARPDVQLRVLNSVDNSMSFEALIIGPNLNSGLARHFYGTLRKAGSGSRIFGEFRPTAFALLFTKIFTVVLMLFAILIFVGVGIALVEGQFRHGLLLLVGVLGPVSMFLVARASVHLSVRWTRGREQLLVAYLGYALNSQQLDGSI